MPFIKEVMHVEYHERYQQIFQFLQTIPGMEHKKPQQLARFSTWLCDHFFSRQNANGETMFSVAVKHWAQVETEHELLLSLLSQFEGFERGEDTTMGEEHSSL